MSDFLNEKSDHAHQKSYGDEASLRYQLAVAHEEMNSRRRNTMEDCHRILPSLGEGLENYSYFGIYDGHGGRQIVDFLEEALEKNIITELKEPDEAGVLERMSRAFLITDMQSKKLKIDTSGATAVSVLLATEPSSINSENQTRKLYVGNVGDSRAVLVSSKPPPGHTHQDEHEHVNEEVPSSGFYGTRLTFDHRAEDPAEQQRIKVAGGFVTRNRVLGILAVSRSFGDHGMKDFVIATPYVTDTDLSECGQCPMLIMACDGVWDVFSDQEAADLLMERFEAGGPFEDAASVLVQAAIDKGSADNVTAIVIFL